MNGERLRQSIESDYLTALGRATYCFAICEWQVVWCAEKIAPGSLAKTTGDEFTAGKIAKRFIDITRNMKQSSVRDKAQALAADFANLVPLRNSILHGKPCTGSDGRQKLWSQSEIEIGNLEAAADSFSRCSSALNDLFYNDLPAS